MVKLNLSTDGGLKFENGKLTLNFDPSLNVEKRSDGVYINTAALGGGLEGTIDDYTVKVLGTNQNGDSMLGIDRDVVVSIFSMCQYQVISRTNKNSYAVNNQIKTISDIVDEYNAVLKWHDEHPGQGIEPGVPHTIYKVTDNDLFQFRATAYPYQYTDGTNTWPVAIDSGIRPQNVPITAFFVITSVTYDYNDRMTNLTLTCLWSSLPEYIAGTAYTYPGTP